MSKNPREEPVRGWRIAYLVACTVGICLSADLLRLHINVHTDPSYQSYCAISERVNCDTLALSPYAVFAGLPLSIWGLVGYLTMASLSVLSLSRRFRNTSWPLGIAFWLSAFSVAVAVPLFIVAHFVVESICIVCAGTYLTSLLLLFFAWRALRLVDVGPVAALAADLRAFRKRPMPLGGLAAGIGLSLIVVWLFIPPYWYVEAAPVSESVATGTTQDGHPWIGSHTPVLTIIEFSDYQCPHCQRGHNELRELIEAYPNKVRLVHRNFPLDQQCNHALKRVFHPHACSYARLAVCAKEQDRFWQANDYLFAEGRRRNPITPRELALDLGIDGEELARCARADSSERSVQEDLRFGRELGVRGTPTFAIGSEIFPGRVPPDILISVLGDSPEAD
jgi:protein-disulfide isomerase/uncharacterized membrane protein